MFGEIVRNIHISCAVLSFTGFFVRGVWMLNDSVLLQQRLVKTAPHIVDTLLLASAITLAVRLHLSPLEQSWLLAKIIALLVYIGIGMVALRFGRNKTTRLTAWLLGLLTFIYIVSVAINKSVLGFVA